jgi:calcium/calmodulin-dependent protein kinase I
MIRETTEARIEFHERYWSKVSDEGALLTGSISADTQLIHHSAKTFIKLLLNPDPSQRPTVQQALNSHVSDIQRPS